MCWNDSTLTLHITGPPPIGLTSKKDADGGSVVHVVVMPICSDEILRRQKEYAKHFGESDDREPVLIDDVQPGTVLQHWGLPNQSPFLFLGMDGDRILSTTEDGHVVGFVRDAWFVVVSLPSSNRTSLCEHAMDNIRIVQRDNRELWAA